MLPFMGVSCRWPRGTFVFARLMGAPVFFATCVRTGFNAFEVHFERFTLSGDRPLESGDRPLESANGDRPLIGDRPLTAAGMELAMMKAFVSFLERETRNCPMEWFHFHDFFSSETPVRGQTLVKGQTLAGKAEIRKLMREKRRKISSEQRAAVSMAICHKVLEREDVKAAIANKATFALYCATDEEIDLAVLFDALHGAGCRICVPTWDAAAKTYRLAECEKGVEFVKGRMGILEPPSSAARVESSEVAVWIVPGLAFDANGRRIGYGGGWYDRFLSAASPKAVSLGVCHSFQLVDRLPAEPHDAVLTAVVAD